MRYIKPAAAIAASLTIAAQPVHAGGVAQPMMEPEVVVAETAAGSGGFIVPLILLALIAAAASSGGGGAEVPRE